MKYNYYFNKENTISAISSPNGIGAIAIIRISGQKSLNIIKKFFFKKIKINQVNLGNLYYKNKIIDKVIIIFFKKPNSYTGEDLIEIYCHGSIYIQNKILNIIIKNGAKLAYNGEFTYRSLLNKKINLLQAESIFDLINSDNKIKHNIAINNLIYNKISNIIKNIQNKILDIYSLLEINLDFIEEKIIFNKKKFIININYILKKIKNLIKTYNINKIIDIGYNIIIIGPVNSGKSTLMNYLINKNKSIITNIPGTTRDIVEGKIKINNFNFNFFDTAGFRKTNCYIENIGIKKTYKKINNSNIIFYVFDYKLLKNIKKFKKILKFLKKKKYLKKKILLIANKIDLYKKKIKIKKIFNYKIYFISLKKKIGLNKIKNYLKKIIPQKEIKNKIIINNFRHYNELKNVYKYLKKFKIDYKKKISFEYIIIYLKLAINHLYLINGINLINKDILNNIFYKFCIGK
ncbi:MAG: tRNA uridine-5-carboxymethylaminomethyl(34) synthesis GTPase MnmE [Candidatus Shikimatogenerans sp. JK-2022]|nr:tRNA uridine-5-carboxymethylaminomethyl(34) synthesis GTPase MnmE [Candidatus Shikimatogenerans bostrichidophilus]